ncbi:DUF998 domain-containing protein [Paenibacillus nasutitermitis]|uniref:DUF998 domain-containing protein n=1 Tax=Paenibacillus nasutitermitis TaxID=1652958 RepID=A0A916ZCN7_9BACL|nr:DUF998 domain-containing protein [Paenibacillus nasutitermitis]GGD88454.1 hypothetical protein GCM10010911_53740 [Paenibacillus nasutitermitis]
MTLNKRLLVCAVIAGPIYIIVGLAQILFREGFDMTRHPLSLMSTGDLGWIQITNFILTGFLVVLGAIGLSRTVKGDKRWRRGALFIGIYGVCVIGGGVFATDPSLGFPPGTPDVYPETISWHSMLHFIFGQFGFLALIIASFMCAWYFAAAKLRGWAAFSACTGGYFFVAIVASIADMGAAWSSIALYVAVALGWIWLTALAARSM